MEVIRCMHINSKCFGDAVSNKGQIQGIVVHSTGAPNKTLRRYVQPSATDSRYLELINLIGKNQYNNDFNRKDVPNNVCPHAFIGELANGEIAVIQVLPYEYCCYGCGSGNKGSYNYNPAYIQFEICEDDLSDYSYFTKVLNVAAEYCAELIKLYPSITIENIVSHAEAHKRGFATNHSDIDHWLKKFGLTMDDFRNAVSGYLKVEQSSPKTLYTVQVGAYSSIENAKKKAEELSAKGISAYITEKEVN